ncbi:MAG TPA: hypothetical protein DCR98_15420 [Cobetia sp.]|nr:hypothetical protein [Cobetia sp.]
MAEPIASEVLACTAAPAGSRANSPVLAMVRHSPFAVTTLLESDSAFAAVRPFATLIFGMLSLIASGVRGGRRGQAPLVQGTGFRALVQCRERL